MGGEPNQASHGLRTGQVWRSCCLSPILTKSAQFKAKYNQTTKPMKPHANPDQVRASAAMKKEFHWQS